MPDPAPVPAPVPTLVERLDEARRSLSYCADRLDLIADRLDKATREVITLRAENARLEELANDRGNEVIRLQHAAWQSIDSAPHNRKIVVFYRNDLSNGRTVLATFYDAGMLEMSDDCHESSVDENGMNVHPGWYEATDAYEHLEPLDGEPTHWQPLPAPPPPEDRR